ncbi:MAG: cytidine deaminase [Planctomycetales bacterium]|nr:cytidine deaminase [Planctomycetales bacterium]
MAEDPTDLIAAARETQQHAYAPYSGYAVGAAIRTGDGRVFTGANVENSTYGATICAERSAAVAAVSAGAREFVAIAIVTENAAPPCGICRQFLSEFGDPLVLLATPEHDAPVTRFNLSELLPHGFRL